jgi:uncharacterized protein (TIGR03663 family)
MGQKTIQRGPRTRRANQKATAAVSRNGVSSPASRKGAGKPHQPARGVTLVTPAVAATTPPPPKRPAPAEPATAPSVTQAATPTVIQNLPAIDPLSPADAASPAAANSNGALPQAGMRPTGSIFAIMDIADEDASPPAVTRSDGGQGGKSAPSLQVARDGGWSVRTAVADRVAPMPPPPVGGGAALVLLQSIGDSAMAAWRRVRGLTGEAWLWIGILALATILRFWGLGDKPLHHDESMHAFFSLSFARDPASYWYDPLLHGPFQFHAEGIIFAILIGFANLFHVASPAGNPWINDTTARLLPATTGVALVAITYGLRRALGRVAAPIAAFLLAVSPAFVYFSRFLREDIYFACFSYLTVMCAVQFAHKRTARWLVATTLAFVLAYATKESIYLNVAVWGAFLAILVVWEIGYVVSDRLPRVFSDRERAFFGHVGPLLAFGAVGAALASWGLRQLNQLSNQINTHTAQTDTQVAQLENTTVTFLLYASIALAVVVIAVLMRQILFETPQQPSGAISETASHEDGTELAVADADEADERPQAGANWLSELRRRLDPRQAFLGLVLSISWVQWFIAFVAGWVLFAALYWIVPGPDHGVLTVAQGFQVGVGRGIWQGLYYWLQQQQIARGGQPWYYYLLLIPLYEQVAVVFGLAGIVRSLARPTRFRLFLVWWFVGALALYSWAGEKMPWLSLHILLPLMLLAAIALEWMALNAWALVQRLVAGERSFSRRALMRPAGAVLGLACALVLLVPTLHGMLVLSHQDAANGPHEMMVYVQTTPDVQKVMDKINHADALLYGGRHQLKIAVGQGEEWPFYWYLRDYWLDAHPGIYASFDLPLTGPAAEQQDVLILTESDAAAFMQAHPTGYSAHTYQLRSWWDEGYKPAPCVPTPTTTCPSWAWGGGVGVGQWLTYGDVAPPNAKFNLGLAVSRLWSWLWWRAPLGADNGSYNFVFIVRDGVPIQP